MARPKRVTGAEPLSYMGVEATTPPQLIVQPRTPTSQQNNFNIGDLWVNSLTNEVWFLTNLVGGVATWTEVTGGVLTVNADTGSATAVNDEMNVIGGNVVVTSATGDTVTVGLTQGGDGQLVVGATGLDPAWATLTSSGGTMDITAGANTLNIDIKGGFLGAQDFTTDAGTATIAGNAIVIAGGTNINTAGAGDTVTINLDADPAFSSLGLGVVSSSAGGVLSSSNGTDGQLFVAGTGVAPIWATLTSTSGTITYTAGSNTLNLESTNDLGSPYLLEMRAISGPTTFTGVSYDSFGSSVWVEVEPGATQRIYSSPDAVTWTQEYLQAGFSAWDFFTKSHCGGDGFCVVIPTRSIGEGGGTGRVWVATDPTATWTQYTTLPSDAGGTFTGVNQGGSHWVLTADSIVYTATDPTGAWTVNSTGLSQPLNGAAYGNSTHVVVGDSGFVATAADPTGAWTSQTSSFGTQSIKAITYSSSLTLFCAVGEQGKVATSPDGITWTQRKNVLANTMVADDVTWDSSNGMFVAVSGDGTGMTAISPNGILWFQDYKNKIGNAINVASDASGNIIIYPTSNLNIVATL